MLQITDWILPSREEKYWETNSLDLSGLAWQSSVGLNRAERQTATPAAPAQRSCAPEWVSLSGSGGTTRQHAHRWAASELVDWNEVILGIWTKQTVDGRPAALWGRTCSCCDITCWFVDCWSWLDIVVVTILFLREWNWKGHALLRLCSLTENLWQQCVSHWTEVHPAVEHNLLNKHQALLKKAWNEWLRHISALTCSERRC